MAQRRLEADDRGRGGDRPVGWINKIVGLTEEAPETLLANPYNYRIHSHAQRLAMQHILGEIGWCAAVVVNQHTGHVIDGHMRIEEALKTEQPTVPVLLVNLSEQEERIALATLDPLGDLAVAYDQPQLDALLDTITRDMQPTGNHADAQGVDTPTPGNPLGEAPITPVDIAKAGTGDRHALNQALDAARGLRTVRCPQCGHEFHP